MADQKDPRLHILLTTDGSEVSYRAIEPVCTLAQRTGARITFLHVVPALSQISDTGFATPLGILHKTTEAETAAARTEMMQALPRFGETPVELDIEVAESASAGIVHYAHDHQVDMIAMASLGRTGLRRILLGSTAENVLRKSPVPVLIFPLHN